MAHPYPKHLDSFDYVGRHAYFLTFVAFERPPQFTDAEAVALVQVQILRAADETGFAVAAYCLMPDHLRLLVRGERGDSDARRFISRAKQYSGYYFSQARRSKLWRRYGYERVVRDEAEWIAIVEYILNNPVRAGLVATSGLSVFGFCCGGSYLTSSTIRRSFSLRTMRSARLGRRPPGGSSARSLKSRSVSARIR
jgi:putative transposase